MWQAACASQVLSSVVAQRWRLCGALTQHVARCIMDSKTADWNGSMQARQLSTTEASVEPAAIQSLFISHATPYGSVTPLTLGFYNYFERHTRNPGFFVPVAITSFPTPIAGHIVPLMRQIFRMKDTEEMMTGVTDVEATKLLASGKQEDLLDKIYASYANFKDSKDFVLVQGMSADLGGTELDALMAQALNTPVFMALSGTPRMTVNDYFNLAMMKRQVFLDHKVEVVGVALNQVPAALHTSLSTQLKQRFEKEGMRFAGAIPMDPVLASVRLDEIRANLNCDVLFGKHASLDKEFSDIVVACQRVEELLECLEEHKDATSFPLVVTSQDRMDIVLALLATQISLIGPNVSGILLTKAGQALEGRRYSKDVVARVFRGLEEHDVVKKTQLPVLTCSHDMYEALEAVRKVSAQPSLLPSSTRKIIQTKILFDKYIDADAVVKGTSVLPPGTQLTPKMFLYNLKKQCLQNPQRIVLPESSDPRVLAAAAEVTARGLARVVLLGDPDTVLAQAKSQGLDLTGVVVQNPAASERLEHYVDALVEARKKKQLSRATAYDTVKGDINMFGVMMVACGDADGMVSGAMHTTAATIRPAMQVLKPPTKTIVSSVFFMCLPDEVLVYGDCAVNPNPNAEELAQIAIVSADTAAAFGVPPRVAMLSYSTLGSGAGPEVQKVTEAVKLVKTQRPDIKVEGPIQYDAAKDPKVAAVKIKTPSEVAGKATVFIFPDLNTGNNTYKAVQQASDAIAMGPVMQGLSKPVNDLSRGCTVPDIINTICVTSIQAQQARAISARPTP